RPLLLPSTTGRTTTLLPVPAAPAAALPMPSTAVAAGRRNPHRRLLLPQRAPRTRNLAARTMLCVPFASPARFCFLAAQRRRKRRPPRSVRSATAQTNRPPVVAD